MFLWSKHLQWCWPMGKNSGNGNGVCRSLGAKLFSSSFPNKKEGDDRLISSMPFRFRFHLPVLFYMTTLVKSIC